MARVRTSRTTTDKRVSSLRFKLTDTMKASAGDIKLGAPAYSFRLGVIPANALITGCTAVVLTASNDTATATATVGTAADPDGLIAAVAPKTAGAKAGSGALINTVTTVATPFYYLNTAANNDATQGEIIVTLEYLELDRADEVATIGLDQSMWDAIPDPAPVPAG